MHCKEGKFMKKKILFFTPLMALLLAGCYARIPLPGGGGGSGGGGSSSTPEGTVAVESVTVTPDKLDLDTVSSDVQLSVEVLPETATDKSVTWAVNEQGKDVISVSETGLVHVLGAGSATVTVTSVSDTSKSDTCDVTVTTSTKSKIQIAYEKGMEGDETNEYTFTGVVTGYIGDYFYVQEGAYGMYMFKCTKKASSADAAVGKLIEVTSKLKKFHGCVQAESGTYEVKGDGTMPTPAAPTTKESFEALNLNVLANFSKVVIASKPSGQWTATMSSDLYPTVYVGDDTTTAYKIKLAKNGTNFIQANADEYNAASQGSTLVLTNAITSYFDAHQIALTKSSTLVRASEPATGIAFKSSTYNVDQGTTSFNMKNELTITPAGATDPVTFSVEDNAKVHIVPTTGILSVDADAVAGSTAKVKATIQGLDPAECTITVKAASPSTKSYKLVTDSSTLANGDQIVITNTEKTAGLGTANNNNYAAKTITVENDVITSLGDASVLVLESASNNMFYIKIGDLYLYAAGGSSNNYLRAKESKDNANGVWLFTYSNNIMSIVASGDGHCERNNMKYNTANNGIFACYNSTSELEVFKYC